MTMTTIDVADVLPSIREQRTALEAALADLEGADDARFWITARGAIELGGKIDPGWHQGRDHLALVAYSDELACWVRIR